MWALSIRQPWAWLICTTDPENPGFGLKPVENRPWKIGRNPRHGQYSSRDVNNFTISLPERIYVHAGKIPDDNRGFQSAFDILRRLHGQSDANIIWKNFWALGNQLGAIIGEITITDCIKDSKSPWAVPGQNHFVLANPVLYDKPIPYRGQLGFFEVKL